MTDSRSKSDQSAVEEVRLNDWIEKELELEDAQGEEEFARESVNKKKRQKTDSKRKRTHNLSDTKRPINNHKSKRQKTYDTPAPEVQAEQQINLQVLTEDEYIIAYIKEEVGEQEGQIFQWPDEINSDQMASFYTLPQIKDEPESTVESSTVSLNIHTCPFCNKSYILPEFLSRHITLEHPNCLLLPSDLNKPQLVNESPPSPVPAKNRNTLGCSSICISSQKVARSLTDRSLDPTQLVIHHPTCPALVSTSQLSPVTGSAHTVQLKRTPKPSPEEAMIPIPLPNSTYQISTSTEPQTSLRNQCPECLRCFSSGATLKRHLFTTHSIVKQYVCRHCEETFSEEVYHLRHLAEAHTGKNPLCCFACQLFFPTYESTQGHLLSHVHTLPPFQCTVCGTIVPSREAQTQPCVLHRSRTTTGVTIKEWKRDTPEETLERLRSNAGPSLDSLALKLGITGNKGDNTEEEEGEGDEDTDKDEKEDDVIWLD